MRPKLKPDLSWRQISAFRLARHNLLAPRAKDLVAISRAVCGIQAQLMASAHMALWARAHHLRPSEITSALRQTRSLVKTLCMRRTLHLIPSDEFQVYITALKPSRMSAILRVMSRFGITRQDVDKMNRDVVEEITLGPITRAELETLVRRRVGPKVKAWMDRVASPFSPAITEGLICYGPDTGRETTYVRIDEWLPRLKSVSERDAKRILFRRYLNAYGPATLQDLSYWSGISMKETREIPDLLEGELTGVQIDGRPGLILSSDYEELIETTPSKDVVQLLPGFDPYLLGHQDKTPLISSEHYKLVFRNQGWISPVVLVNGEVVATWSSKTRNKRLSIEISPIQNLSKRIRTVIHEEAASLASFLDLPIQVAFTP